MMPCICSVIDHIINGMARSGFLQMSVKCLPMSVNQGLSKWNWLECEQSLFSSIIRGEECKTREYDKEVAIL